MILKGMHGMHGMHGMYGMYGMYVVHEVRYLHDGERLGRAVLGVDRVLL